MAKKNSEKVEDLEFAAKVFHEQAIESYVAARLLLSTNKLFPAALYNAHLAFECMLKSLRAQAGLKLEPIHNLVRLNAGLREILKDKDLYKLEYVDILDDLNPYQELGRYGAMAREEFDANRISEGPIKVYGPVSSQPSADIKNIDYVFALLWGKSKLKEEPGDTIGRIIRGEGDALWRYPIPIEEIVLSQNEYLKRV